MHSTNLIYVTGPKGQSMYGRGHIYRMYEILVGITPQLVIRMYTYLHKHMLTYLPFSIYAYKFTHI